MTRLRWGAIIILMVFGLVRMPIERSIASDLKEHQFREGSQLPDGPMREKLGQLGAAAALGGFRSFLATIYELRAMTAFSDVDYDEVESSYQLATQLQPREPGYWEMAGYMMDTNARRYYLSFDLKHSPEERVALVDRSVVRGKMFLDDGLRYNPEDYALNRSLANHYAHRQQDLCAAADAFARAASVVEGRSLAERHHAIFLAHCPGKELEAYVKLRAIAEEIPDGIMPGAYVLHLRYLERFLKRPKADWFQTSYDLRKLYDRLLPTFREGANYPKLHRMRLERLQEVLNIPEAERLHFNPISSLQE